MTRKEEFMASEVVDAPNLGWIGTGRMGAAMVRRLLAGGHRVTVYNRTREKAEALIPDGALLADDVAELAGCDVVFTCVSSSPDLEQVTVGDGGLLRQDRVPSVIVDSSTVSAETSATVREAAAARGVAFLAAPVSGNAKVVAAGKLTLVVSGAEEAYQRVAPLLQLLGRGVAYVGDNEGSRLVKIAHNVFLGVVTQSLAEITVLVEKGGVSRAAFLAFLNDSVMGSTFTRYKSPAFVNLDFTPTFTTELLRKDFEIGLEEARGLGVSMPVAALTHQLVQAAVGAGHRGVDFATLLVEAARNADLELKPEDVHVDDGLH
ncbi:MAG TPA: NAD(P)-dependent oxidoreductase [Acidothermaceae bacterium]|nr:NAD(P)-dependent oxidoreductase [Acidothermaceae bacterium]